MTLRRCIIPIFVPHLGCPNDCVFCNQRRISGQTKPATPDTVKQALRNIPGSLPEKAQKQLAFYGGSFTAIPTDEQIALLKAAGPFLENHRNASLRISTRPDCIDGEILRRLISFGVKTIELGAQSMDEDVLKASGRGHTAQDTVRASRVIRQFGFELILQMMTGLPGDTPSKSIMTAKKLIDLQPDGVRIYPTVIIRDTKLHEMWMNGDYMEHTVDDAVGSCSELVGLFEKAAVPIIRLGLNPTEDLSCGDAVAGAYHPALGELVYSRIYLNRARMLLKELKPDRKIKKLTLGVSPNRISAMVGHKRSNAEALKREFGIDITVKACHTTAASSITAGEIVILCIDYTQ